MRSVATEVWRYRGLVGNFARRELKCKYKGSVVGWAWSLVNPLATLAVYTPGLRVLPRRDRRRRRATGLQNFPIYLFTGLVVWNFFNAIVTGQHGRADRRTGPLLRKIYFPPFAPVVGQHPGDRQQIGHRARPAAVRLRSSLLNIGWTVLLLPLLVVLLGAFSLGVGLLLATLNARCRDINYMVQVGLNLLFYATPIIYPITLVGAVLRRAPVAAALRVQPDDRSSSSCPGTILYD